MAIGRTAARNARDGKCWAATGSTIASAKARWPTSIARTIPISAAPSRSRCSSPIFARDPELGARFLREARAAGALSHRQYRDDLRCRRGPGRRLYRDGADRRPAARRRCCRSRGACRTSACSRSAQQLGERARLRASLRGRASRHQAVEHPAVGRRQDRQAARFRRRADRRDGPAPPTASWRKTQVGQLIGTPRYMSPEQALGPAGRPALRPLFARRRALRDDHRQGRFPGTALATLAIQIAQEKVEPIDRSAGDCPPGLRFIIDKLLAKKPEQRFADGDALAAALAREIAAQKREAGRPARAAAAAQAAARAWRGHRRRAVRCASRRRWAASARRSSIWRSCRARSTAAFVTNNAAVLAAENAGLPAEQQDWSALQAFAVSASQDPAIRDLVVVDTSGIVRAAGDAGLVGTTLCAADRRSADRGGRRHASRVRRRPTAAAPGSASSSRSAMPAPISARSTWCVKRTALDAALDERADLAVAAVGGRDAGRAADRLSQRRDGRAAAAPAAQRARRGAAKPASRCASRTTAATNSARRSTRSTAPPRAVEPRSPR